MRVPVSIFILVKNPNAQHKVCQIHYYALGEGQKKEQKLNLLRDTKSIQGIEIGHWEKIEPDSNDDWLNQQESGYESLVQL